MLTVFALGSLTPALAQELTQPPGPVGLRVPRVTSGALTPSRFPSKWTARHPVATGAIVGAALGGVVGFRICSEDVYSFRTKQIRLRGPESRVYKGAYQIPIL